MKLRAPLARLIGPKSSAWNRAKEYAAMRGPSIDPDLKSRNTGRFPQNRTASCIGTMSILGPNPGLIVFDFDPGQTLFALRGDGRNADAFACEPSVQTFEL